MNHVLVTNDFPPKHGGIQSYLWELWRRLPPDDFAVLTTPYSGDEAWDAQQPFRVERTRERVLLPTRGLAQRIDRLADEIGAELVLLDPALPLGFIGRSLRHRYGVVIHGAEVTVPGRLPGTHALLRAVLRSAELVVSAGGYPLHEAARAVGRSLPAVEIPPGVDVQRFHPLEPDARAAARIRFGLPVTRPVVLGVSRLVPRKGFDVVVRAMPIVADSHPEVVFAIAGAGRDHQRLELLASRTPADVRFLGRVDDLALPDLYGCADVFAMACRSRWLGLEQEGFGIVFLEAAAAGVPQVAGASGGSHEAVVDRETGFVVPNPHDEHAVASRIVRLLDDSALRARLGAAARARAVEEFSYDHLARRLGSAIDGVRG